MSLGGNPVDLGGCYCAGGRRSIGIRSPGITDSVIIVAGSGSDNNEILPISQSLVNGTTTFGASNPFFFSDQGTWTITVMDQSNANIPSATSASVIVVP